MADAMSSNTAMRVDNESTLNFPRTTEGTELLASMDERFKKYYELMKDSAGTQSQGEVVRISVQALGSQERRMESRSQ